MIVLVLCGLHTRGNVLLVRWQSWPAKAINSNAILSIPPPPLQNIFSYITVLYDCLSGADPENIHGRWLTEWLPIVIHTGAKGVAG